MTDLLNIFFYEVFVSTFAHFSVGLFFTYCFADILYILYYFPQKAITMTTSHVAYTTEMYCFTVLEASSTGRWCCQSEFLLRSTRKNLFHASLPASGGLSVVLWCSLTCRSLPSSSHDSLPECLFIQFSPFRRTAVILDWGPLSSRMTSSAMTFQMRSPSKVLGVRMLTYEFGGEGGTQFNQ